MEIKIDTTQAIITFDSMDEFQNEYEKNISAGGISLSTTEMLPLFNSLQLVLRLNENEAIVAALVVRHLPEAMALAIEGDAKTIFDALTKETHGIKLAEPSDSSENSEEVEHYLAREDNVWQRVRALSRTEKLMLAPKADRGERAILAQENDPQIIIYLLKNPRIGNEEVVRIARMPLINSSIAELIAKTSQWINSPEIKIALVGNPRTPTPIAMRLLPTLPEPEIRQIAKGNAVNQALKQAALRLVVNRGS